MASSIDVRPLARCVRIHFRLDSYDADASGVLSTNHARVLAARLLAAADVADRSRRIEGTLESLR